MKKLISLCCALAALCAVLQAQEPAFVIRNNPATEVTSDFLERYAVIIAVEHAEELVYTKDYLITCDAVQNGASLYASPDTLTGTPATGVYVMPFNSEFHQGMLLPQAGGVDITFYLWKVDTAEDGSFAGLRAWVGDDAGQITLTHHVTVIAVPEVRVEIVSPYCGFFGANLVYNEGRLPRFEFAVDSASRLGDDLFILATVTHRTTANQKHFCDTVSSLVYTFAENWRDKLGENPDDEGDRVPQTDDWGDAVHDYFQLNFALVWKNGDVYRDITPNTDGFKSAKMLRFYDGAPDVSWQDYQIEERSGVTVGWDEDDNEIFITAWHVDSYFDSYPVIENGWMGVGTGCGHIVFELADSADEIVFTDTLRGEDIVIDSAVSDGLYTMRLTLLLWDEAGNLAPAQSPDGQAVAVQYHLLLGDSSLIVDTTGSSDTAVIPVRCLPTAWGGVKIYPNPCADGRFNIEVSEVALVEVFALNGHLAQRRLTAAGTARFSGLHSGVYVVRVTSTAGKRVYTQRIVVR